MNIPHDFSCHEGSKNVYFIQVRNLEGQNHPGHTVSNHVTYLVLSKNVASSNDFFKKHKITIEIGVIH